MGQERKARQHLSPQKLEGELLERQRPALLRALGLLNAGGRLNADAHRKLKQVNHLVTQLSPLLLQSFERWENPAIVDAGCGKSYLGFVLYESVLEPAGRGTVLGIDVRQDLVDRSASLAKELKFERMAFACGALRDVVWPERVQVLTALHACDTATDDALFEGISRGADHIVVVPCCQAEVARQLAEPEAKAPKDGLEQLYRHPIQRREFGAHLTNVLRCLTLEAHGYQVVSTELVGWEHSMKNELILAKRINAYNKKAQSKLDSLLAQFNVMPTLNQRLAGLATVAPPVEAEA